MLLVITQASEFAIDDRDGMSYIRAAEDIVETGIDSPHKQKLVQELFVLAAVVDPTLRESSILGLLWVQRNIEESQVLRSMLNPVLPILVHSVVSQETAQRTAIASIHTVCEVLHDIREGRGISDAEFRTLNPWGYLFQGGLDNFVQRYHQRRRKLSETDIESSLLVELAVLGGPTQWSADYAATHGTPVALSVNDDLATLFKVDPTRRNWKNGEWVP